MLLFASFRLISDARIDFSCPYRRHRIASLFTPGSLGHYDWFDLEDVMHMARMAGLVEWTNDGIYYVTLSPNVAQRILKREGFDVQEATEFGLKVKEAAQ